MRLNVGTLGIAVLLAAGVATGANAQSLQSFGVVAGSTITNTGATTIDGNVALYPGTDIPGLLPAMVLAPYAIHQTDAVAQQAQSDLTTTYNLLKAQAPSGPSFDLTGQDLGTGGADVLTAGVYNFASTAQLNGNLTLDGEGNANAVFIFNIGSTLTTAGASSITLTNGALGSNVFFRVGSSATLGTTTQFVGDILADQSITLQTGADITCGAALARIGAVTLDTNNIISSDVVASCTISVPGGGTTLPANATSNEREISRAIDAFVTGGGVLPLAFQVLLSTSTPTELAAALDQLSGEAGASVAPTGISSTNSFLALVLNQGFDSSRIGPSTVTAPGEGPTLAPVPAPAPKSPGTNGTVKALDYGPEDKPNRVSAIFAAFDRAPVVRRPWQAWAAAYGGQDNLQGDDNAGTHDTVSRNLGFAAGIDYWMGDDARFGAAFSSGTDNFTLSDGFGGGRSNVYQAALYGRMNFNDAYLSGALAYGWYDELTDRTVTIGQPQRLTAEFAAHDIAGQLEAGYRLGWFTPYASVRVQGFSTPAYGETSDLGASVFALDYQARTTIDTRTEVGGRFERSFGLPGRDSLSLRARVAWAHDFWSNTGVIASFQSIPGSAHTVTGATPPSDSFLLSGGSSIGFGNGVSLASSVDLALASGSQSYAGSLKLGYAW